MCTNAVWLGCLWLGWIYTLFSFMNVNKSAGTANPTPPETRLLFALFTYWSREDAFILLDIMRLQRCSWRILKAVWEYADVILRLLRVRVCVGAERGSLFFSFVVISSLFYYWMLCMRRCILVTEMMRVSWSLNNLRDCFKAIHPQKMKVLSIFTLHYAFFFFF